MPEEGVEVRILGIRVGIERRTACPTVRTGMVNLRVRLTPHGPVAQLGARLNGIQEVTSSILVRSTNSFSDPETGLK